MRESAQQAVLAQLNEVIAQAEADGEPLIARTLKAMGYYMALGVTPTQALNAVLRKQSGPTDAPVEDFGIQ